VREEDVITDDTGTPVAEMIGNNLYIYYPVYSSEMRRGVAVFRKILEAALASRGTPRKRAALRKAREEARLARIRAEAEERISRIRAEGEATRDTSRETYVTACAGRFEHTVADTRRAIEKSGSEVEELQAKLVEAIRRGSGLQRKLSQMLTVREGDRGAYAREFDKLFSVPNVIDVRVDRGTIVVFTDTLYCVDPRTSRKHEIGAFRITIRMDGAVTWNNETRKIHGYDAPHVDGGKACLGNVSEVLPQLAGNYEYAALVMVAIQFIESVNVDDPWGETINQWPIAA
jgi:hypothetical protein